jgi:hypothetical protein
MKLIQIWDSSLFGVKSTLHDEVLYRRALRRARQEERKRRKLLPSPRRGEWYMEGMKRVHPDVLPLDSPDNPGNYTDVGEGWILLTEAAEKHDMKFTTMRRIVEVEGVEKDLTKLADGHRRVRVRTADIDAAVERWRRTRALGRAVSEMNANKME